MAGFKDVDNTKIWTFYPAHGVSDIQKLQMTTQEGENVRVCAINGNFDDAQSAVKKIFSDSMYRDAMSRRGFLLSSANSINWGRLAPQVAYYFSAYCELVKNHEIELGQPINFVVPTGNFGNILAGYYAKIMGVPIHKLICASNENNVLTEFFRTGKYNANREFHVTASPSMDILVSSNLERLIFELLGRDGEAVAELMDMLKKTGFYAITESQVGELYENFWADCCDDVETAEAIAKTYREGNYVIDPHTATAVCVYDKYKEKTADTTKTVIVSTASPFKFADFVVEAIFGQKCFDSFESIKYLVENGDLSAPSHITQLNEKEIRFADVRDKEEIKSFVDEQFV
jgi:threonine synthase